MGKRKNRNRKNNRRSQNARIEHQYAKQWRNKNINSALNDDEFHEKQSKFHKNLAKKQQDILSRSIFVTCVKDLKDARNLRALERFFAVHYGPVFQCVTTKFPQHRRKRGNGRGSKLDFPPARVVFVEKTSAERVFGGIELFRVQKSVDLECPTVGYRNGKITVQPCMPSKDLLVDEETGSKIKLAVSGLSLGHWCPAELEMENLQETRSERDVWLEVERVDSPQVTIDMKERVIELTHWTMWHTDRVSFRFKQLLMPMKLCREQSGVYSIIFSLKHPPRVSFMVSGELEGEQDAQYERTLNWQGKSGEAFGYCLGYKLEISENQMHDLLRHEKRNQLREFGVFGFDSDALQNPNTIQSSIVGNIYRRQFEDTLKTIRNFKLAYLLSVLRDSGRFTSYHAITDKVSFIGQGNLNILEVVSTVHHPPQVKIVGETLEKMISAGFGYTKNPCRLLSTLLKGAILSEDRPLPLHCVLVPRVLVSPLRTVCAGFEIETSNRVIRYFTSMSNFKVDMFMRVTIIDDDGSQLMSSELTLKVEPRIQNSLVRGITCCGRTYEFLAYSSSQLKECSAWMVCCQGTGWDVVRMREELGNFSNCKTVSKLGARLGQCFSTTFTDAEKQRQGSNRKFSKKPIVVADIEGSKGCHSDGSGMIRRDVLNELLLQLPIGLKDSSNISIIQIRYGGAKGTLTAFDEPTLYLPFGTPKVDVYLRPSMVKFIAPYIDLEVCSVGRNVSYFLNRNVILLLNTAHNVPEKTFINLQKEMLDELDEMLTNREMALRLVPSLAGPENEQRSMILHMLHAGLDPLSEPFLYDCLSAVRSHHLFSLRKKSRIWVEKGSVLVGGIDVTGSLPENCVFFQVESKPYVGPVLVTKHPVMHPGDVRMLNAIDEPSLRNHRNMIFFSKHGDRPEANKMSGSDLDGDEFAVCWDKRLFIGRNAEAMDYAGPDDIFSKILPSHPDQITEALVQHFLDHIKNASLGQIAMLWLDHAAKNGAHCPECIELAALHSVAVDYPKSGVPAIIPKHLKLSINTPRPHWREKKNSPDYHCPSVIGKLYDAVIHREKLVKTHNRRCKALAGRKVDKYGTVTCDISGTFPDVHDQRIPRGLMSMADALYDMPLSSDFQTLANEERELYDTEVLQMMNKYHIRSEGETYTGCIRKYHKLHKKRQHDFTQVVRQQYGEIRQKFRRSFFDRVIRISEELEDPSMVLNDTTEALAMMQFDDAEDGTANINGLVDSLPADIGLLPEAEVGEDSESEASIDDERIRAVEVLITKQIIDPSYGPRHELLMQRVAFALAAAYYSAAYHREHHWAERDNHVALFGFPWLVADVIGLACAPYLHPNANNS